MVPSISSLVAATLACEFVASLPGPAAWAENVFLPERKVALVAASQPIGHHDLLAQAMMQVTNAPAPKLAKKTLLSARLIERRVRSLMPVHADESSDTHALLVACDRFPRETRTPRPCS